MDYATPNPDTLKEVDTDNTSSDAATPTLRQTATDKARLAAQDVQNKATQLKNAASEKAQKFRSFAGDKASSLKEGANSKAQVVKQAASERYEQSKAKAKDFHTSSEDYIREHPTKCVVGAFGVGLLIGLLSRRG